MPSLRDENSTGEKREVAETRNRDIIMRIVKDGGDKVDAQGKIQRYMFTAISSAITTDEVIITEERIEHSNRHDNAYDKYKEHIPEVLSDPDLIFRDKFPNTAILIREIEEEGKHIQLVLRLHVQEDEPEYKNSILSFWDISERRKKNYLRNKEAVYRKPKL